jgi:hypothetical protein
MKLLLFDYCIVSDFDEVMICNVPMMQYCVMYYDVIMSPTAWIKDPFVIHVWTGLSCWKAKHA